MTLGSIWPQLDMRRVLLLGVTDVAVGSMLVQ